MPDRYCGPRPLWVENYSGQEALNWLTGRDESEFRVRIRGIVAENLRFSLAVGVGLALAQSIIMLDSRRWKELSGESVSAQIRWRCMADEFDGSTHNDCTDRGRWRG